MNEKRFLRSLLPVLKCGSDVLVPPGDDCAMIEYHGGLLLAVDQLIPGIHCEFDTAPSLQARKLLCRNLSDIAAVGGRPLHALVTVAGNMSDLWLTDFMSGLQSVAAEFGVEIIGGDLSSLPSGLEFSVLTLTITGKIPGGGICRRGGAESGDLLVATGEFGRSFESGHHLEFNPRLDEGCFLAGFGAHAMIDVSDGLLGDASQLASASGLALELSLNDIPLRPGADLQAALTDGEDYELLAAIAPDRRNELMSTWNFDTGLSVIGVFVDGIPGMVNDVDGDELLSHYGYGWNHGETE